MRIAGMAPIKRVGPSQASPGWLRPPRRRCFGQRFHDTSGNGSSPRVRGTPLRQLDLVVCSRFIPAGAGNARLRRWRSTASPVHPRGCGERTPGTVSAAATNGSSPRVRGTPDQRLVGQVHRRFIPAGAGNARARFRRSADPPVHPRGCGERAWHGERRGAKSGSSPRVRGTLFDRAFDCLLGRFIPAGAGNAQRRAIA